MGGKGAGRGLAEEIFCIVEADPPDAQLLNFSYYNEELYRGWRTLADGRDCFTLLMNQAVLPPGTEQIALSIRIVCKPGQEDRVFNVSCGSIGGPGAAQTIVLPGAMLDAAIEELAGEGKSEIAAAIARSLGIGRC